jgi:hypothetical protein
MLRAGLVSIALAALVAGCAGTGTSIGTYCAGCAGGEAAQVLLRPTPSDPRIESLQLNLAGCPEATPAVVPIGGATGVWWEAKARKGAPANTTQFTSGEVHVEVCDMVQFRGSYWLGRDDGTRVEGRIDGRLTVDTPR